MMRLNNLRSRELPVNPYSSSAFALSGALSIGLNIGWSAVVENTLKYNLDYDPEIINEVVLAMPLGAAIGALIVMPVLLIMYYMPKNMKYGTSRALWITGLPLSLCGWWTLKHGGYNFEYMKTGRFLNGLSVGFFSVLIPMYIAEISNGQLRDILLSSQHFIICVGIGLSYWIGWFYFRHPQTPEPFDISKYSFYCGMTCIISLLSFLIPRSPMERLYSDSSDTSRLEKVTEDLKIVKKSEVSEHVEKLRFIVKNHKKYHQYLNLKFLMAFIASLILSIFQYSIAVFLIMNSETWFGYVNDGQTSAEFLNVMLGHWLFFTAAFALILIYLCGRKMMLIFGAVLMAVTLISISHILKKIGKNLLICSEVIRILYILVAIMFAAWNVSLGPGPTTVICDSFPVPWRVPMISFFTFLRWFVLYYEIKALPEWLKSMDYSDLTSYFAYGAFLCAVISFFMIHEHKGLDITELHVKYWEEKELEANRQTRQREGQGT